MDKSTGYGSHPTIYGKLSDESLYQMYRSDTWKGLDETHRQQLLQETVNRSALEHGELGSCQVVFSHDLKNGTDGEQTGNVIRLDYEKFVNDRQTVVYKGETQYHEVADANFQALTTVFHEDEHAWQNQVIDGTIASPSEDLAREFRANNFTLSLVEQDGNIQAGSHYLNGSTNYYLYYFQSTEREAFRNSEAKTAKIMEGLEAKFGSDSSIEAHKAELSANGYASVLKEAQEYFQNPNIEKDINNTLMNQYYGTKVPVNPAAEAAVKREMIQSYQEQYVRNSLEHSQEGEKGKNMANKVNFANLRVSEQEYNQMLRDSVNAYYEHALRDPSMSKEEAEAETAKMAERYLDEMEKFRESQLQEKDGEKEGEEEGEEKEGEENEEGNEDGNNEEDSIENQDEQDALETQEEGNQGEDGNEGQEAAGEEGPGEDGNEGQETSSEVLEALDEGNSGEEGSEGQEASSEVLEALDEGNSGEEGSEGQEAASEVLEALDEGNSGEEGSEGQEASSEVLEALDEGNSGEGAEGGFGDGIGGEGSGFGDGTGGDGSGGGIGGDGSGGGIGGDGSGGGIGGGE